MSLNVTKKYSFLNGGGYHITVDLTIDILLGTRFGPGMVNR